MANYMPVIPYGHNFGNSETKGIAIIDGEKRSNVIPSVTAPANLRAIKGLELKMESDDFIFQWDSNSIPQYIGEMTFKQSHFAFSGRGDIKRYIEGKNIMLLCATAASIIRQQKARLLVTACIPYENYLQDIEVEEPDGRKRRVLFRDRIKAVLQGTHSFILNDTPYEYEVIVERILPEGAAALVVLGTGKVAKVAFDIGGGTTDIYAVDKDSHPQTQYCGGFPIGVETVSDLIATNIRQIGGRKLTALQKREILRAYASNGSLLYPELTTNNREKIDVKSIARNAFDVIGPEILSNIRTIFNGSEDNIIGDMFQQAFCIGGGDYYFYHLLQSSIPGLQRVQEPHLANAYGCALFSLRQLSKKPVGAY